MTTKRVPRLPTGTKAHIDNTVLPLGLAVVNPQGILHIGDGAKEGGNAQVNKDQLTALENTVNNNNSAALIRETQLNSTLTNDIDAAFNTVKFLLQTEADLLRSEANVLRGENEERASELDERASTIESSLITLAETLDLPTYNTIAEMEAATSTHAIGQIVRVFGEGLFRRTNQPAGPNAWEADVDRVAIEAGLREAGDLAISEQLTEVGEELINIFGSKDSILPPANKKLSVFGFKDPDTNRLSHFFIHRDGSISLSGTNFEHSGLSPLTLIGKNGQLVAHLNKLGALEMNGVYFERSPLGFVIKGSGGQLLLAVDPTKGIIWPKIAAASEAKGVVKFTPRASGKLASGTILGNLLTGQSLVLGTGGLPRTEITQPYLNLMFPQGTRVDITSESDLSQFVPLTSLGSEAPRQGPGIVAANEYARLRIEDGSDVEETRSLVMQAGRGGQGLAALGVGSPAWESAQLQIDALISVGASLNMAAVVDHRLDVHGESDTAWGTDEEVYYDMWKNRVNDYDALIMGKTKQTIPPVHLISQTGANLKYGNVNLSIANAQRRLGKDLPTSYLIGPNSHYPRNEDGLHLNSTGYDLIGAYAARARMALWKFGDWRPLEPISVIVSGNLINIQFNVPYGKLVVDTEEVSPKRNYGFDILEGGVPVDLIQEVFVRESSIILKLSRAPLAGFILQCGAGRVIDGEVGGPEGGGGTNIHDGAGYRDYYTPADKRARPMHNWLVHFHAREGNLT